MKHNESFKNIFTGFLLVLMCAYILASVSLFQPKFNINAYAHDSFSIPKAQLIIQNQQVSMSPFVYVDGGKFKKISFPALAGSNTELNVEEGTPISFDFSRKPLKVDAFIVDYDGDIPSLLPLKKVGFNSFEIASLPGIWNIEVHATFPGGEYLSYTALANVLGNAESLSINSIGHETACSNQSNLKIQSVSDKNNKVNSLAIAQTLNGNNSINPNTSVWSSTGKGSWIQFDLGKEKSICKLLVGFANGDKEINSFSVQTSTDGIRFVNQGTVQNTGMISGAELFNIPNSPILARYVKISFQSNGQGEISDFKIIGADGIVNVGNANGASSTSGIEGGSPSGNGTNASAASVNEETNGVNSLNGNGGAGVVGLHGTNANANGVVNGTNSVYGGNGGVGGVGGVGLNGTNAIEANGTNANANGVVNVTNSVYGGNGGIGVNGSNTNGANANANEMINSNVANEANCSHQSTNTNIQGSNVNCYSSSANGAGANGW